MTALPRVLNKETISKEYKKEVDKCIKNNMTDQVDPTIIWDTVKSIMRRNLISAYLKKLKRSKYDEIEKTLRKLKKQQPKN